MKLHKFYGRNSLVASLSVGGLFLSSQASAQIINWAPVNVAVPLSTTSTIIMGLLLLAFGMFVAPRIKSGHKGVFVITAVLAGLLASSLYIIDNKAHATASFITTASGPKHLLRNSSTTVDNGYSEAVRITELNPEDCHFTEGTSCKVGDVLNPGDSCNVNTFCETSEGGN